MITIPPIYVDIPLREYDQAMPDLVARVWVNPSLSIVRQRGEIARQTIEVLKGQLDSDAKMAALEELRPARHDWLISVLNHGEASETRWIPDRDEINGMYEASPDFVRWLTEHVSSAIDGHLEREKKVLAPR